MLTRNKLLYFFSVCFLLTSIFGSLFSVVPKVYANPDTETLRPSAAGDITQLVPVGTTPNWNCTDEATSDSDTTYVRSSTTDDLPYTDLYNIPDTAIPSGSTINNVTVYILARATSVTYKGAAYVALKTGGSTWYGSANGPSTTYTLYLHHWLTNPTTTLAWTVSDINALQIGVKMYSGYRDDPEAWYQERCTQVYVDIDYFAPSGTNLFVTLYQNVNSYATLEWTSQLGQNLFFSLFQNVNVSATLYQLKEMSNTFFNPVNVFSNLTMLKALGFRLFQAINLFSNATMLKSLQFKLFQNANLWSSLSILTTAGQNYFVTLFESLRTYANLGMGIGTSVYLFELSGVIMPLSGLVVGVGTSEIDMILALAAFGVIMAMVAIALAITKRD